MFIPTSALLGMHSIYIGHLVQPATAPLIYHMHVYIGGVAITKYYPYPAAIPMLHWIAWLGYNIGDMLLKFCCCNI